MSDTTVPKTGKVVWHDLMTTDLEASKTFFTELFGWELKEFQMGEHGTCNMIHVGGKEIGTIVALDDKGEIPAHWMAYVSVDDVDAAVERAKGMGGQEAWPATDIPDVGRFAVIRDPQGGHISPWKSAHEGACKEEGQQISPGEFCWEEFLARDPAEAARFYGELFGWTSEEMDMGEMGTYTLLKTGDRGVGGIMKMPAEVEAPPHWLSYVLVEDVDATVKKIEELGGMVYKPGTDIPGIGRFAVAADPAGAAFAIYKSEG